MITVTSRVLTLEPFPAVGIRIRVLHGTSQVNKTYVALIGDIGFTFYYMIVIVSSENDTSTEEVIRYLIKWDINFFRINDIDRTRIVNISISNCSDTHIELSIKKPYKNKWDKVRLDKNDYLWYRRGDITLTNIVEGANTGIKSPYIDNIKIRLEAEEEKVRDFIYMFFYSRGRSLNTRQDNYINKLAVLQVARDVDLKIPHTVVSGDKNTVLSTLGNCGDVITKAISENNIFHRKRREITYLYTSQVQVSNVEEKHEVFFPSLLQNLITKDFELRIFYLEGEFYAAAILSQKNDKTKIDFRNYDDSNPNRVLRYTLPNSIKEKITRLMVLLNLNSGSIDMIVSDAGEYIFLEVNPIGQYMQISVPCNYNLSHKIALLMKNKIDA